MIMKVPGSPRSTITSQRMRNTKHISVRYDDPLGQSLKSDPIRLSQTMRFRINEGTIRIQATFGPQAKVGGALAICYPLIVNDVFTRGPWHNPSPPPPKTDRVRQ